LKLYKFAKLIQWPSGWQLAYYLPPFPSLFQSAAHLVPKYLLHVGHELLSIILATFAIVEGNILPQPNIPHLLKA